MNIGATRMYRLGKWKLLISRPEHDAYGHLSVDILQSLHTAKAEGAAVYFLIPPDIVNRALFDLQAEGVKIVRRTHLLDKLTTAVWNVSPLPEQISMFVHAPSQLARRVRGKHVRKYRPKKPTTKVWYGSYFRRLFATDPIAVWLPRQLERKAADLAAQHGLLPSTKLVTLHVREPSTRRHDSPQDLTRTARIDTYADAIDLLVRRGYTVVRIGDSVAPFARAGLVDLASTPSRSDLLQLWLLLKSAFFIGCDSGPNVPPIITNTPSLIVNVVNPLGSYPIMKDSLLVPKRPIDNETGSALTLAEMFSTDYFLRRRQPMRNSKQTARYGYIDNSSGEICEAVGEMLDSLASPRPETEIQLECRNRLLQAAQNLPRQFETKFFGTEELFVGAGRIAHFFAERYLNSTVPQPTVARR